MESSLLSNVLNLHWKDENKEKDATNGPFVQDCGKRTLLIGICKGKYHCTDDLLFDFGFGQTSKSVVD